MRTAITVMKGGNLPWSNWIANQRVAVIPDRTHVEPWIRLTRYTYDDNDRIVKRELGVFGCRGGEFEIRWKEFQEGALLTDIAPISDYLVWEK